MSDVAAELTVDVKAKETVTAVLQRLETELQQSNSVATKLAQVLEAQLARSQTRSGTAALQHAQAQARLQASSGNTAAAIRTLQQALEGVDRGSAAAIRAETHLVQLQRRLVQETVRTTSGTRSYAQSLLSLAGPLGVATTGIGAFLAVAGRVKEGFDLRATLDEQRRSVGTLLGDVQRGNQIFAEAAAFGRRYGYTQREMGQAAATAAPLIRTSTTAVEKQLEVLGRLASLNTNEGFSGAVFSTKELASGDITSIVERFNLNRKAANDMKAAIASGADVFKVLDDQLNKMGVTADVLGDRMQGAAGATRTFAQAQEDLTLALGQFAEGPGVKVLDFLTGFTSTLTNILTKGDAFAGAASGADAIQAQLVGLATSYEDYGNRLTAVNQQVRDEIAKTDPVFAALVGSIQQLTPAQFAYAQALIQTGTAQADALQKAQALTDVSRQLSAIQDTASMGNREAAAALSELSGQILQAASASPEAADGVLAMASAMASGDLEVENFRAALAGLIAHNDAAAAAASSQADANIYQSEAMIQAAAAGQEAAAAMATTSAEIQKSAQESIIDAETKQTQAAVTEALRQKLDDATNAFLSLNPEIDQAGISALVAAGKLDPIIGQLAALRLQAADAANQVQQLNSTLGGGIGGSAKPLGRLDRGGGGVLSADAIGERIRNMDQTARIYAHFNGVETRTRARSKASGKAHVSDQQKLNNELEAQQEKTNTKLEEAAIDHQERLLQIERDFQEKLRQQRRKNEIDKRESEADVLEKLTGSDLNASQNGGQADLARINAQYYADFEASQKAAQQGQAKLSEDILDLAEKRASMELEYAERIDAARAKSDETEIARLETIRDRRRKILDEQQKQLLEDGDAIVNDRNQAEQDEANKYAEQTGKIISASDQAREQKVNNAIRSGKAVDQERVSVDRLTQSYERLGTVAGTRGAPAPSASTPVPVSTTPVDASGQPLDAGAIVAALQQAQTAIVNALSDVERAVDGTTSAVQSSGGHVG